MKIAMSGATGFVGQHLCRDLQANGDEVIPLTRTDLQASEDTLAAKIEGCDVIVNLCGETINQRWSAASKQRFFDSRVVNTQRLVKAMGHLTSPPNLFISTSAIGAFDAFGTYSESSTPNASDFLGDLSRHWEQAATAAELLGIRTIIFRFALVLGRDGGLLKQLLLPFRLGLGGRIGDGHQPFSWIHIDDLISAYRLAFDTPAMNGLFHLSAPHPLTNKEFTKSIGRVLHRPTLLPMPKWVLKIIFGEGADVMTSGQRVISERLPQYGYQFNYPHLEAALKQLIGNRSRDESI